MTVFSLMIALPNNGGEKVGSTQGGMVNQPGFSVLVTGPQLEPCLGGSRILNGPLWAVVTVSGCGQAWQEVRAVEGLVRSWGRGESGHLKPGTGRGLGGKAHRAGKGIQNLGKSWVQGWLRRVVSNLETSWWPCPTQRNALKCA